MEGKEKKSLASAQQELAAVNQILEMQRKENLKQQEHIEMLDGEIDALKNLLEGKQREVNRLVEKLHDKQNSINTLNEKIKSLKVDHGAIQVYSKVFTVEISLYYPFVF
jgi:chromosome segregation ATPase